MAHRVNKENVIVCKEYDPEAHNKWDLPAKWAMTKLLYQYPQHVTQIILNQDESKATGYYDISFRFRIAINQPAVALRCDVEGKAISRWFSYPTVDYALRKMKKWDNMKPFINATVSDDLTGIIITPHYLLYDPKYHIVKKCKNTGYQPEMFAAIPRDQCYFYSFRDGRYVPDDLNCETTTPFPEMMTELLATPRE